MRSTTPLVVAIAASTCADAIAVPRYSAASSSRSDSSLRYRDDAAIDPVAAVSRAPLGKLNLSIKRGEGDGDSEDDDGDESDGEDDDGDGEIDEADEDHDEDEEKKKSGNKAGPIAGGVIGGLVGVGVLVFLLFWFFLRPRRLRKPKKQDRALPVEDDDHKFPKRRRQQQQQQQNNANNGSNENDTHHMAGGIGVGFAPPSSPPDYIQSTTATHSEATSSPMSLPAEKVHGVGPAVPGAVMSYHASAPPNYDHSQPPPSAPSPDDLEQQQPQPPPPQESQDTNRPTAPTTTEILASILPSGRRPRQEDENHIDPNPDIPLGPQTLTVHPADQPNPEWH